MSRLSSTADPAPGGRLNSGSNWKLPAVPRSLITGLTAAGVACRVIQYGWNRSFWVDEASLALNIRAKAATLLLGPLDYHQAAPPLFLLAERGMVRMFGFSEWSMRLLPLLAGCAAVVLFAILARRLLTPWAAVLAVAMFAFADRLIWHAVEAKPYGTDVFAAVVLILIAAKLVRSFSGRRLLGLCAAGAVSVWLSYPSVFVFGGISAALLPTVLRRGPRTRAAYLAGNLLVVLSFAAVYLLIVRHQQSQSLAEYWAEDFIELGRPWLLPVWLGRHLLSLCNYPTEPLGFVVLPCAIAGGIGMARGGRRLQLAMLVNPIGVNLVAAAAHKFPFDGARITAYLAPAVLLLSGAGAATIYRWLRNAIGPAACLPAALIAFVYAGNAAVHCVLPRQRGHVRPAARFVESHVRPDDGVYALQPHEFACYWPQDDPRVHESLPPADRIPYQRFWIVWAYPNPQAAGRIRPLLAWARTFCTVDQALTGTGYAVYLCQLKAGPRPHTAPPDLRTHHKQMSTDR